MLIKKKLLSEYGASSKTYLPFEKIFKEGEKACHYYQIISGVVKLNHISQGSEVSQSILRKGESLCDLLLLTGEKFPVNAIAITKSNIIKIPKANFDKLLIDNSYIRNKIPEYLARRIHHNQLWLRHMTAKSADERVLGVLKFFKKLDHQYDEEFLIPYTRAQLASMTGLRVETVIRSIKKMEEKQILKLKSRKIYF